MAELRVWDLQWEDANGQRNYPLHPLATAADVTGAFRLPQDVLVGLDLPVPADSAARPGAVYLSEVVSAADGLTLTVSAPDGPVAAARVAAAAHAPYACYPLTGVGAYAGVLGSLVVGRLDALARQPAGRWAFDAAGGRLDPDVVRPAPTGVTALVVRDGGADSAPLRGTVILQAGPGARLRVESTSSGATVTVDCVGSAAAAGCGCADAPALGPAVRTINGIPPDDGGNFGLVGAGCLSFAPGTHQLTATDTCSSPCCGCPELDALTAQLAQLRERVSGVAAAQPALQAEARAAEAAALAARLSGCEGLACP